MSTWNPAATILAAHFKGVKARLAAQAESDRVDQEEEARAESIRQFDLTHASVVKEQDAQAQLRKSLGDVQALQLRANLQRQQAETGLTPPGATSTQTPDQSSEDATSMLGQNTTSIPQQFRPQDYTLQGPSTQIQAEGGNNQIRSNTAGPSLTSRVQLPNDLGSYDVPDPVTYANQQAQREGILNRPKIQGAIDTAQGIAPIEVKKSLDIAAGEQPGKMELITEKQAADTARDKQKQDAATANLKLTIQKDKEVGAAHDQAKMAASMYKVNHPTSQIDPEDVANIGMLHAAGQMELPTDKATRNAVISWETQNHYVPPPKGTNDKLNALGSLGTIFKQFNDVIEKDLSNNWVGQVGTSVQAKNPYSDLHADLAAVNLNDASVSRLLEGTQGRQALSLMKSVKDDLGSGTMNKVQAHKNLEKAAGLAFSKAQNEVMGSLPLPQQKLALKMHPAIGQFYKNTIHKQTGESIPSVTTNGGLTWTEVQ